MTGKTQILPFDRQNPQLRQQAAQLLADCFPHAYADCAAEQIDACLDSERLAFMAIEDGQLAGFVGAIPQYSHAWELHPLAVRADCRGQGIGAALLQALEAECARRGVLTLFLGTDDEFYEASLSASNLFYETYQKMAQAKNLAQHPFTFYQKCGYQIVGVIPDANGLRKPDILMAKSLHG